MAPFDDIVSGIAEIVLDVLITGRSSDAGRSRRAAKRQRKEITSGVILLDPPQLPKTKNTEAQSDTNEG